MSKYYSKSIALHKKLKGKIEVSPKMDIQSTAELATVYSPGVAQVSVEIEKNPSLAYQFTLKGNTVAIVSDGSAVLGLGNIGPEAAIPVMEGKAMLFKKFAGINAFPICLDTQDSSEIIETVKRIAPVFGGINLEDISSPRCFEIEKALQHIGIPVFHDDQHGTAIVVLAGLINACKVLGKEINNLKIVINGSGAAGIAIARLLAGDQMTKTPFRPAEIIMCDSKGIIHHERDDLNPIKQQVLSFTNPNHLKGGLQEALKGADVFIGVSKGNILFQEDIRTMKKDPVIFSLANPDPEIRPEEALQAGAAIVATGRSDFPNQINNVLVFPGIFKGALQAQATCISREMKIAAAIALADCTEGLSREKIIPSVFDSGVTDQVASAVRKSWEEEMTVLK